MSRADVPPELRCPAASNDRDGERPDDPDRGTPCRKPMYRARNGEVWDHAGGHMYASDATLERLDTWHYDAGALLAGQPTPAHSPDDCPGPQDCLTARIEGVGRINSTREGER